MRKAAVEGVVESKKGGRSAEEVRDRRIEREGPAQTREPLLPLEFILDCVVLRVVKHQRALVIHDIDLDATGYSCVDVLASAPASTPAAHPLAGPSLRNDESFARVVLVGLADGKRDAMVESDGKDDRFRDVDGMVVYRSVGCFEVEVRFFRVDGFVHAVFRAAITGSVAVLGGEVVVREL